MLNFKAVFTPTTLFLTDQIIDVVMVTPSFLSVLRTLYSEAAVGLVSGFCLANDSKRDFQTCFADIFCLLIQTTNPKMHLT